MRSATCLASSGAPDIAASWLGSSSERRSPPWAIGERRHLPPFRVRTRRSPTIARVKPTAYIGQARQLTAQRDRRSRPASNIAVRSVRVASTRSSIPAPAPPAAAHRLDARLIGPEAVGVLLSCPDALQVAPRREVLRARFLSAMSRTAFGAAVLGAEALSGVRDLAVALRDASRSRRHAGDPRSTCPSLPVPCPIG